MTSRTRFEACVRAAMAVGAAALAIGTGGAPASAQPAGDEPSSSYFETIPPVPATLRRRLRFQILERDQGLPQSNVTSIVQDRAGFMWLGTQDGAARYDGQRFVVFRHDPAVPSSLSASHVTELLVARDGTLWLGTEGGGVNRYHPDTSTFDRFVAKADAEDALKSGSVQSLAEGPDGRIWIGTGEGGLGILDPKTGKVSTTAVEDGLNGSILSVLVGEDGAAWVGTDTGMFHLQLDGKKATVTAMFPNDPVLANAPITAITRDKKGDLWIGTGESGLAHYSPATKKIDHFKEAPDDWTRLADPVVQAIYEDRAGRVWVATEKALHILDPATGKFERQMVDSSDSKGLLDQPVSIYQDASGVMWIGTFSAGAALLDPRALLIHNYTSGSVSSLFVQGKDVWVTDFDHTCRWQGALTYEGVCYEIPRATPMLVDRSGAIWVGTAGQGLYRLDKGSKDRWILYQNNPRDLNSLAPGIITSLYEDRGGRLWIGQIGGGLQRFDPAKESFVTFQLPTVDVYKIKEDPKQDGVLWVGTLDQGLLRVTLADGQTKGYLLNKEDPKSKTENAVADFVFEGDKTIWLATYGAGLKRMDRSTFTLKTYRIAEGMPSDTLYAAQFDKAGKLWISTIAGLVQFDTKTEEIHVFSAADGLQSNEFVITAAATDDQGRLYFGGIHGFDVFNPEEIQIDSFKAPVVVTSIDVLGERYSSDKPVDAIKDISLDYDEASVAVQYAALSFSGSDRYEFEYQLEPTSDKWQASESGVVSLAGLASGDYTLLMRARNRHGVESEPIKLGIAVARPPWFRWWAFTTYGVVLAGLLFWIWRAQKVRIDRLQKLARLATVEKEFEVTAAVQSWFLPETVSHTAGIFDLVGFYRGAEKCSGDWWWYEDLGGGKLWVIVADVTGHGAGPAMLTAAVAMGLSVQGHSHDHVVNRLERVNREVLIRCKGKATMTMTALVLDQSNGEVTIYGMGGLPALLMGREGRHTVIGASGTPLGSVENLAIGERSLHLAPGDRLLITTDGIIETTLAGGRQLGFRRFVNVMRESSKAPLHQAVEQIVRAVDQQRARVPQEDDFTFCLLERRG